MNSYATALLRRRWPVVALATLFMLAMAVGARFIGITNDYRSFFDEDNPQLSALVRRGKARLLSGCESHAATVASGW